MEAGPSINKNNQREGSNGLCITHDFHVLLVDPEKDSLVATARTLEMYSYKVTAVQSGMAALSMLSHGNQKFDLILTEIRLPDIDGFDILHEAVKTELPTILLAADDDAMLAKIAIENGACFFLEKPVGTSVLKNLWQYVTKERLMKAKVFGKKDSSLHETTSKLGKKAEYKESKLEELKANETNSKKSKDHTKKKVRSGRGAIFGKLDGSNKNTTRRSYHRKTFTEWTEELHNKFVAALNVLGEGKCYPRKIMELMNEPGLTRMQVASHLQKCRNEKWRSPETRRKKASSSNGLQNNGSRKFGAMPPVVKSSSASHSQTSHPRETRGNHSGLDQIYSTLANSIFGNKEGGHRVQLFHTQTQTVTNCFGVTHNPGMQSMGQFAPFGSNGIGNGEESLSALLGMNTNQNSGPVLPYLGNIASLGAESHNSYSNQNPVPQDCFDFIPQVEASQFLSQTTGELSMTNFNPLIQAPPSTFEVQPIFFDQHLQGRSI